MLLIIIFVNTFYKANQLEKPFYAFMIHSFGKLCQVIFFPHLVYCIISIVWKVLMSLHCFILSIKCSLKSTRINKHNSLKQTYVSYYQITMLEKVVHDFHFGNLIDFQVNVSCFSIISGNIQWIVSFTVHSFCLAWPLCWMPKVSYTKI